MGNRAVQGQRANIITARKVANRDRNSEYKATSDVLAGIYDSARTGLGGTLGSMTTEQTRQLAALQRLAGSKAQSRVLAKGADRVTELYGIAGAAGAKPTLDAAAAAAKGSAKTLGGIAGAGGLVATGNEAAAATMQTGLQSAQAAAQSQTAQALEYRAKNDASLVASQQLALQQTRLQAKLDYENWKKQFDYTQQSQDKLGVPGMAAVAQAGATSFTGLRYTFNSYTDGQGNKYDPSEVQYDDTGAHWVEVDGNKVPVHLPNATQAAQDYINENGIVDQNQQMVVQSVATAMYQAGVGKGPNKYTADSDALVRQAVTSQLAILYPSYAKHADQMDAILTSYANYDQSIRAQQAAEDDGTGSNGSGGQSFWNKMMYQFSHPLELIGFGGGSIAKASSEHPASTVDGLLGLALLGVPEGSAVRFGAAKGASVASVWGGTEAAAAAAPTAEQAVATLRAALPAADETMLSKLVTAAREGGQGSKAWEALRAYVSRVGPSGTAIPLGG